MENTQQAMREVTKDRFYAIMGPLNVHPRAMNNGRTSDWIMQTSPYSQIGKIARETWESPDHYFVTSKLAA